MPQASLIAAAQREMYSAPRSRRLIEPVVSVASTAPSSSCAALQTSASCAGVLTGIVCSPRVSSMPQKPHCSWRAPVDALLHDGRGDRVEVQQRDLPVRDPVRRLHVVDLRAARQPDDADELLLAKQRGLRAVEAQRVRRAADVLGVLGHRQRQPADVHEQRVRRAGAAAPAQRAVAADDAHAEGLQLDEQPAVVERQRRPVGDGGLSHGCRRGSRSCARRRCP